MFEKIVWALFLTVFAIACLSFAYLCLFVMGVPITFSGELTLSGIGTMLSVGVALYIANKNWNHAADGREKDWKITAKIRDDDRTNAVTDRRKEWDRAASVRRTDLDNEQENIAAEIRRIAISQAKMLFREFEVPTITAIAAVYRYSAAHSAAQKGHETSIDVYAEIAHRRKFFKEMQATMENIEAGMHPDPIRFRDASFLYQHSNELGDAAANVIIHLQAADFIMKSFITESDKGMGEAFETGQDPGAIYRMNGMLSSLTGYLQSLEEFRILQKNINYRDSKNHKSWVKIMLRNASEILPDGAISPESHTYLEVFSDLHAYFKT